MRGPTGYSCQQNFNSCCFLKIFLYKRVEDQCRTAGINEGLDNATQLERRLQKCKTAVL